MNRDAIVEQHPGGDQLVNVVPWVSIARVHTIRRTTDHRKFSPLRRNHWRTLDPTIDKPISTTSIFEKGSESPTLAGHRFDRAVGAVI